MKLSGDIELLSLRAIKIWGLDKQMVKTCEELAELQVQLCKRLNGSPTTDENIVDEIADVTIMAFQMAFWYGEEAVSKRIKFKLDRLEKALNREEANNEGFRDKV